MFYIGIVLGSNHSFPYKTLLADEITATKIRSSPIYSFPKQRRGMTDVPQGRINAAADSMTEVCQNAVKTDNKNLSPGPIYKAYQNLHPTMLFKGKNDERAGRGRSLDLCRKHVTKDSLLQTAF